MKIQMSTWNRQKGNFSLLDSINASVVFWSERKVIRCMHRSWTNEWMTDWLNVEKERGRDVTPKNRIPAEITTFVNYSVYESMKIFQFRYPGSRWENQKKTTTLPLRRGLNTFTFSLFLCLSDGYYGLQLVLVTGTHRFAPAKSKILLRFRKWKLGLVHFWETPKVYRLLLESHDQFSFS